MAFLEKLITNDTKILELKNNPNISEDEKLEVLDLRSSLSGKYIKNMYYKNGIWYYFKEDIDEILYPYYTIDELIGSYLAKKRGLPTVSYEISKTDEYYGLASINFKKKYYEYDIIPNLIDMNIPLDSLGRLKALKSFAINYENEQEFLLHLFNLFTLDIHMLQKDRGDANLQFETNLKTGYFDIAPVYDYSNCSFEVGMEGINIPSKIVKLDYLGIRSLAKTYSLFKKALEFCLEESLEDTWKEICDDYHFNQDCTTYEDVLEHLHQKDTYQKQYIKEMLKNIK